MATDNPIRSWLKSFVGGKKTPEAEPGTAVDAVLFLAAFASKPQDIDTILDEVRHITAINAADDELSEKDQLLLAKVAYELEEYLVENEPERISSMAELTEQLRATFKPRSADAIFWESLASATS